MAFTAAEIRLIALMAKKGMPLHQTVKALSEALPNVHPHKILDMAKLAVDAEAMDAADGDTDGDGDGEGHDGAADGDDGYDAESAEDPYHGESAQAMTVRHAEELARCATDDERAQCIARHAEEKQAFERRWAEGAAHRQGADRGRQLHRSRVVMTRRELDAAVARHPMMISAQKAINDLRGARSKETAERLVDEAIDGERLIPAQREWAVAYCTADLAGFQRFISKQPAMKLDDRGSPIGIRQAPPAADDPNSLTAAELAICAQTRCTPVEYLKRKTYNAARITGLAAQATMLRIEVGAAPTAAAAQAAVTAALAAH